MHPITVIILNKTGNPNLQSIIDLDPQQILLGTFSPIKVEYKQVAVINLKNNNNYGEALNELQGIVQTDWILYLKDNETILQFNEYIPNLFLTPKEVYGFQILQDDVIIKEPRLWNKKEQKVVFKNPVFEKLNIDSTKIIDVMLYQSKVNDPDIAKRLDAWKRASPLSVDATYYKAFGELAKKNFVEFKRTMAHYLFNMQRTDIPSVMARYYLALIQGVVDNDTREAIKNIVICLAENPLMAEFWCLLGDIFVKSERFEEAISFYENAIILGNRRLTLDLWPMHISKYDTYPNEMIGKCKVALKTTEVYQSNV